MIASWRSNPLFYRTSNPIKTFGFYRSPICACHSWSKRLACLKLSLTFFLLTPQNDFHTLTYRNLDSFHCYVLFLLVQDQWRGYMSNYWPQEWIYTWMIQYYKITTSCRPVPSFDPWCPDAIWASERLMVSIFRECCQQHRAEQQISWGGAGSTQKWKKKSCHFDGKTDYLHQW